MTDLTSRQDQVARLVADGLQDKQIARALGIGERRVRQIIGRLAELLELEKGRSYRTQLAQRFARAA